MDVLAIILIVYILIGVFITLIGIFWASPKEELKNFEDKMEKRGMNALGGMALVMLLMTLFWLPLCFFDVRVKTSDDQKT